MSEQRSAVTLHLGQTGQDCRVTIDGHDITSIVRAITVHAEVHDVTRVTLDLLPSAIDIEGIPGVIELSPAHVVTLSEVH